MAYPVIHRQLAELRDAFRPFHQQEELLLNGFANVGWASDLLRDNFPHGQSQSRELHEEPKQ